MTSRERVALEAARGRHSQGDGGFGVALKWLWGENQVTESGFLALAWLWPKPPMLIIKDFLALAVPPVFDNPFVLNKISKPSVLQKNPKILHFFAGLG